MMSLRSRLTWSYIFFAIICVALISILANITLERQFRRYVVANLEKMNRQLITRTSGQYHPGTGWDRNAIEDIGIQGLEQGLIITVRDTQGQILWDAMTHNNRLCQQMIAHMSKNMTSRYPGWRGGYMENRFNLTKNFKTIGTMTIGYYGPFFLTDTDLSFINTLNHILLGVTLFALLFSLMLGTITAKWLSAPITEAITAAEAIAEGNYRSKFKASSHVRELQRLRATMERLASVLQHQETLRKRLTADVAHELRTPIATLQSHLEAMIDGIWEMDKKRLEVCHGEILRIQRIVQDLSRLAKYETEPLQYSRFDMTQLFQGILASLEPEAIKKNISLALEASHPMDIEGDRDRLSQVAINLLTNGLKYTASGGQVLVALNDSDTSIEVRIEDNGPGINAEDLPYIFERFYRADKSRTRSTGGSGIGLTISKAIVDAHGGTISVHSAPGKGTRFTVRLPKKQPKSDI